MILADDSVLLREGLSRLLSESGFEVTGAAGDAEELLRLIEADPPDVAVVDIRMPPSHTDEGIRAAREIRRRHPGVAILVLSQYRESVYAVQLLSQGAERTGYLLKDRVSEVDQVLDAIRRVAKGETVVDPEIVALLVRRERVESPLERLTPREVEILSLMAEGRSNQWMSESLFLSPKTIESHVAGIFSKLGLEPTSEDHRRVVAVLTYLRAQS